ncbi:MAG: hypothetical protein JNM56_00280 [Planctomycetia bacterium]|nr:hypothetical protein [Planctomycetia bacterium]
MDPLLTSLLDLLFELREQPTPITIGGGSGLFLKRQHLLTIGSRMLLAELPQPRATNDLDLFIRAEILADLQRTTEIRDAIRRLGYQPVEEARYLQWKWEIVVAGMAKEVKIDLLVGPLGPHRAQVHVSAPRARPKGKSIEFHAHCTDEAVAIEEGPILVSLTGTRSGGQPFQGTVFVPQAFPYLMMKLFAFSDRKADQNKDLGRHHALDLYTIIGMMTEEEYEAARRLAQDHAGDANVQKAHEIVREDFASDTNPGVVRLREHPLFRPAFLVPDFLGTLKDIFKG